MIKLERNQASSETRYRVQPPIISFYLKNKSENR